MASAYLKAPSSFLLYCLFHSKQLYLCQTLFVEPLVARTLVTPLLELYLDTFGYFTFSQIILVLFEFK